MLNDAAVSHFKKVYLAPGYTDLRRGIDGFASIVRFQFELDPYDKNTLFLFCGRKKAAGSRHQINCLILLMSVHSRFVCTVFQICSFIAIHLKAFALVFYLTKKIVRGSDHNVSHTLSFILCGMLLILDCCLTGIDCLYHIHIKLGFTFIGIQTV